MERLLLKNLDKLQLQNWLDKHTKIGASLVICNGISQCHVVSGKKYQNSTDCIKSDDAFHIGSISKTPLQQLGLCHHWLSFGELERKSLGNSDARLVVSANGFT